MISEVIIVGSGAAGTFAALALREQRPVVLDVGLRPPPTDHPGGLAQLRQSGNPFDVLIGRRFESLHNIADEELPLKVKAPLMRYVIRQPAAETPVRMERGVALTSYAAGGLANAWGAQLYRYNDEDLPDFPICANDLLPYYEAVEREIGVSGAEDDLARFHGSQQLLPPLRLGSLATAVMRGYQRRRRQFRSRGIFMGRPRLAVLSTAYRGRPAYEYRDLDFFEPGPAGIYSPVQTLDSMIQRGAVDYRRGWMVERFREQEDHVELLAVNVESGERTTFRARIALLCLGALNTTRLVLRSRDDTRTRLSVVENPMVWMPLLSPGHVGRPIEYGTHPAQLNLFCEQPGGGDPVVGMLYSINGLLRSDLLGSFPLDAAGRLAGARYVLPAMMALQLFWRGRVSAESTVRLDTSGALVAEFGTPAVRPVEARIIKAFRSIGFHSHSRLVRRAEPGGSIHYGGTLPMRAVPASPYETDRNGRLHGSRRVFIGDAATFPTVPAKNLTLTIMSNAMRIATAAVAEMSSA